MENMLQKYVFNLKDSLILKILLIGALIYVSFQLGLMVVRPDSKIVVLIILSVALFIVVIEQKILLYFIIFSIIWLYNYWWYTETPLFNVGANVYLADCIFFLVIGSVTILVLLKKEVIPFKSRVGVTLTIYLVWGMICIFRGFLGWGHSAVGEARYVLVTCLYFPVVYAIKNINEFTKFLKVILILVLSYVVFVLILKFFSVFEKNYLVMLKSRVFGSELSVTSASIFVFFLCLLLTGGVKKYKRTFILLTILFGLMPFWGFRTGSLALVISTIFVFFIIKTSGVKAYIQFLVLAIIFMIIFTYLNFKGIEVLLDTGSQTGFGYLNEPLTGTAVWRLQGWVTIIKQTLESDPIFGQGFGGYYDIYRDSRYIGVSPHNDWLVIFSKMGAIGLILFLSLVIRFYRVGFRYIKETHDRKKQGFMRGLLAVFLVGLVGGTFFMFFPIMWIAVGIQSALVNITDKESRDVNKFHMKV